MAPHIPAIGCEANRAKSMRRASEVLVATRAGLSAEAIASGMEISERQVVRLRARLRAEGRLS